MIKELQCTCLHLMDYHEVHVHQIRGHIKNERTKIMGQNVCFVLQCTLEEIPK